MSRNDELNKAVDNLVTVGGYCEKGKAAVRQLVEAITGEKLVTRPQMQVGEVWRIGRNDFYLKLSSGLLDLKTMIINDNDELIEAMVKGGDCRKESETLAGYYARQYDELRMQAQRPKNETRFGIDW